MFYFDQEQRWETIDENAKRKVLAVGEQLMYVKVVFERKGKGELVCHSHPHEQLTYVLQGAFLFKAGAVEKTVRAGDSISFPAHIEHGCLPLEDGSCLLDVFSPLRQDFLTVTL